MPLRLLHFVSLPYCSPKLWIYRVGAAAFPLFLTPLPETPGATGVATNALPASAA